MYRLAVQYAPGANTQLLPTFAWFYCATHRCVYRLLQRASELGCRVPHDRASGRSHRGAKTFACAFMTSLRGAVAASVKPHSIDVFAERFRCTKTRSALTIGGEYSAGPTSRAVRSAENRQLHECMRASTHCGHLSAFRTAGPRRMSTWPLRSAKPVASTRHATRRATIRSHVATHHLPRGLVSEKRIRS